MLLVYGVARLVQKRDGVEVVDVQKVEYSNDDFNREVW